MERENYYLLLELSVDPPEEDDQTIEDAIRQKQAQWSRYRNHPTKSILSKQYIGMIPDIRNVMTVPRFRKKEAEAAKLLLRKKEKEKFSTIDRHLDILMSKGSVNKKEIARLTKMHGVKEDIIRGRLKKKENFFKIDRQVRLLISKGKGAVSDKKIAGFAKRHAVGEEKVREWIEKKQQEQISELDACIGKTTEKGYITQSEIIKLANLYGTDESDIVMRAKCPIKKDAGRKSVKVPPLDKTLEKLINDKLSVVGKASLYKFLGRSQDSDLKDLQERAREKEMEIRRIGQKDAQMTASGALAGHCIVIFRTKERRKAYDMSLAHTHLKDLDSDINVAGTDGKIRQEYFSILVRKAIRIGMDTEEAFEYVREYCHREKWTIREKKKWFILDKKKIVFLEKWTVELDPKKKSFWIFAGSVAAAIIILVSTLVVSNRIIQAGRLKKAYENTLAGVEKTPELEKKEKMLQAFLNNYGDSEHASTISSRIRQVRKQREQRDLEKSIGEIDKLLEEKKYEDAQTIGEKYLKKYAKKPGAAKIRERISQIPGLIDDRDYEVVLTVAGSSFDEKIQAYNHYFTKHPEGSHIEDVRKLIEEMVGAYYSALQKELKGCEKGREWERCIQLCDAFTAKFGGTPEASEVAGFHEKYRKRLLYEGDMAEMRHQANPRTEDRDYTGAKEIWSEYLVASPEAPAYIKKIVKMEIAGIEQKHRQYVSEEKEWENLLAYSDDPMNSLTDRVKKLDDYVKQNPSGRHTPEALPMLTDLKRKKKIEDESMRETRRKEAWVEIVRYVRNSQASLADKVSALEKYIKQDPPEEYIGDANTMLNRLRQDKQVQDEQLKLQKANRQRTEKELKRMRALVRKTRGRFVANGNGTITDKKTGLMWCALDSLTELGQCTDYQTSMNYVQNLRTGDHSGWRLPTVNELAGIYKITPFFPSAGAKWYWTSEVMWRGWNKQAYVLTTKQETAWIKQQVELVKCGAARAVRP